MLAAIAQHNDVAIETIDVDCHDLEPHEDVVWRGGLCLEHASGEWLAFPPDCNLNQTARCAPEQKLMYLSKGVQTVRKEPGK